MYKAFRWYGSLRKAHLASGCFSDSSRAAPSQHHPCRVTTRFQHQAMPVMGLLLLLGRRWRSCRRSGSRAELDDDRGVVRPPDQRLVADGEPACGRVLAVMLSGRRHLAEC